MLTFLHDNNYFYIVMEKYVIKVKANTFYKKPKKTKFYSINVLVGFMETSIDGSIK